MKPPKLIATVLTALTVAAVAGACAPAAASAATHATCMLRARIDFSRSIQSHPVHGRLGTRNWTSATCTGTLPKSVPWPHAFVRISGRYGRDPYRPVVGEFEPDTCLTGLAYGRIAIAFTRATELIDARTLIAHGRFEWQRHAGAVRLAARGTLKDRDAVERWSGGGLGALVPDQSQWCIGHGVRSATLTLPLRLDALLRGGQS
jgi:hypothetical protein